MFRQKLKDAAASERMRGKELARKLLNLRDLTVPVFAIG
jgi:hypothetical protein